MEFKLNIGDPKSGKTHKKELSADESKELIGLKIGDKVKGDKIGFSGYEFELTGGSDFAGFPMRRDVNGTSRKKVLIASGVGTRHKRKGIRLRRNVAGNTVYTKTAQINLKVIKAGKGSLDEAPAESTKAPKEEPKEEKKEAPKEEPKEEKKEAPKEEPKEESKEKVKEEQKEESKEEKKE